MGIGFIFTKDSFRLDNTCAITNDEEEKLYESFENSPYETLYEMSFSQMYKGLDAAGTYLFQLSERFTEELSHISGIELSRENTELEISDESMEVLLNSVPFVLGSEFVKKTWIKRQYRRLLDVFKEQIKDYPGKVSIYFTEKNSKLMIPERVFFHIVENKENEEYPFAFLATYATRTENGRVRHVPLQYALTEYRNERGKLVELLSCLNKSAEVSPLIAKFMESGELFHPLGLNSEETYQLLKDVPKFEKAGIRCRIPNWWKKRYSSLFVSAKMGEERPNLLGLSSVLSTVPSLTVGGVPLSEDEINELLSMTEGLHYLKGRWIEVNHERLKDLLSAMERCKGDVTLLEALKAQASLGVEDDKFEDTIITNGKWLKDFLKSLRNPEKLKKEPLPDTFAGELRHYQNSGYQWLSQMNELGFGACLADDMGLGKTVQILAFLESLRTYKKDARALLIVPASLLGNWTKEAKKFTPDMDVKVLYGAPSKTLAATALNDKSFLTITTYRMAQSIESLKDLTWDCLILDEAQAIKNPAAKQTRFVKQINSRMRITLTGTPIENDLSNLWSLFDFLNKGLLGSSEEFRSFCKELEYNPEGYSKLKNMIAPFLLRRVKTDKKVISDLPDKIEQKDYIELSKKQTVLYRKLISQTQAALDGTSGMQRRGIILSLLLHLKQICNHPDQYLGQTEYNPSQSGKFEMLKEICETIYEKRERVLVFTQFKELTPFLDDYLAGIFHCRGAVIHGSVPVKGRNEIVTRFQSDEYMPYLVISVKAGGTGLNLTNASHVIHFDRWWNPSVENQATDRAFRIGQKNNVMVHKFVCQGTIEEKIDTLIASKKELAENVIGSGGEKWITEMSDDELMSMLRLDV